MVVVTCLTFLLTSNNKISKRSASRQKLSLRGKNASSVLMVRYVHPRNVMPPKFVNMLKSVLYMQLPASTNYTNNPYALINFNSIYEPFNSNQVFTASTGASGFAASLSAGCSNTQGPAGYSIMSAVYDSYRVLSASFNFEIHPSDARDLWLFTVSACGLNSRQTSSFNPSTTQGQNSIKEFAVQFAAPKQSFNYSITSQRALGLSKAQFDDLPTTTIGGTPATSTATVLNINGFLSATESYGLTNVVVRAEFETEWSNQETSGLES